MKEEDASLFDAKETAMTLARNAVRGGEEKLIPILKVFDVALAFADRLRPYCDEVKVAGDIRRKKPAVKEISCVVRITPGSAMLDQGISKLFTSRYLEWDEQHRANGPKQKRFYIPSEDIPVVIHICQAENFGNTLAHKTGDKDFVELLMVRGKIVSKHHAGGFLRNRNGDIIPCLTEEDYFRELSLPCPPSHSRNKATGQNLLKGIR